MFVGGYFEIRQLHKYKAQTAQFRQAGFSTQSIGVTTPSPDLVVPDEAKPVEVGVGIYINHIARSFSLKTTMDCGVSYIWFSWSGDQVHPGDTFEVVDGQIEYKVKMESYSQDGRQYECYHVRARILSIINASRVPLRQKNWAFGLKMEQMM